MFKGCSLDSNTVLSRVAQKNLIKPSVSYVVVTVSCSDMNDICHTYHHATNQFLTLCVCIRSCMCACACMSCLYPVCGIPGSELVHVLVSTILLSVCNCVTSLSSAPGVRGSQPSLCVCFFLILLTHAPWSRIMYHAFSQPYG